MRGRFLRAFWNIFKGYWNSEEKWKARGLLVAVLGMSVFDVYLLVELNTWYNEFYNALQNYEKDLFWPLVGKFSLIAGLHIFIVTYAIYLRQALQLKWRIWMTNKYLAHWMEDQSYYRMQVIGTDTDNPDQRISEDIDKFSSLTLPLLIGIVKEMTTLAAFAVILWNLSGVITVPLGSYSFEIYGYMFWFSLFYSLAGTVFAHLVGRRLIGLNFDQQRYEADFRFNMMRVRENSESVAFYHGEDAEHAGFLQRFSCAVNNYWKLIKKTRTLNYYVNGYGQLACILPLILASPLYFQGTMALGGLMQAFSAFGRVQDALSYFVTTYDVIAELSSVNRRLATFTQHMNDVQQVKNGVKESEMEEQGLWLEHLDVKLPDDRKLLEDCNVKLPSGSRLLVTGASGCGKSTLLRTLAGIWPYGNGEIRHKKGDDCLFLPQRPYLPLGTLRMALCYPLEEELPIEDLKQVLEKVGLLEFAQKLEQTDDWSRILSLGEQQRLAFARVLLVRPDWVFLDEATSALDEPREQEMYALLRSELPNLSMVSVAHRSTLISKHNCRLELLGDGKWSFAESIS